jgi:hypothetical protein
MMGFESLLGSALTPAIETGVGETAMQTLVPALTDTTIDAGLTNALAGTGLNSLGQATAGLGLDQTAIGAGLNNGYFQSLGNLPVGFTDAGVGEASNFATGVGLQGQAGGMFDGITNSGLFQTLGSDQAKNIAGIGFNAYNAMNQSRAIDDAKKIQKEQLAMSQDAYNRDKRADERRQKLVF